MKRRSSISMSGVTHARLRAYAESIGSTMSGLAELWIDDALNGNKSSIVRWSQRDLGPEDDHTQQFEL